MTEVSGTEVSRTYDIGGTSIFLLHDGAVMSGCPSVTHPDVAQGEMDHYLRSRGLPLDRLELAATVILVEFRGQVILIDAGVGRHEGAPASATGAGKMRDSLAASGWKPDHVDAILLTHCHSDHIGGLINACDHPIFPNAEIYVSAVDHAFWSDPVATGPRWDFDHGMAKRVFAAYWDRLTLLGEGGQALPGVKVVPTPGHTVGHTSFVFDCDGTDLWVLGDVCRHHLLNLERPDWQFIGDADPLTCVATRRRILDLVAKRKALVHSYHFPRGGLGHILATTDGYRFHPISDQSAGDESGNLILYLGE